jgi:dihydrofolate reductase (trimethoprim resistance protein)
MARKLATSADATLLNPVPTAKLPVPSKGALGYLGYWQLVESSGLNERLIVEQSRVVVASHDHQFQPPFPTTFGLGDRVRKKSGAAWQGCIVGWYSTQLTPEGYAVESEAHPGSVQIYPVAALERVA